MRDLIRSLPMLRRFARTLAPSEDAADDLVQEACKRALSDDPPPASEGQGIDLWAKRLIRNVWQDWKRNKHQQASAERLETGCMADCHDGWLDVESHISLGDVRRVLGSLPAEQRSVMILVCVDGLSYQQAADQLGIPIGTVMSRLSRGRLALMKSLRERRSLSFRRAAE
ncbi:RNA polymerase sigma factor [Indioceanicola profundi]|uniref:RNA polymerase sigma factor n=1 Tax=Indioceanicola profundi TaxID=2220096 RepID=UPI000E6ADD60|nr:RNA polymerase sigma factor [Indioceanicola profundi]